MGFNKETLKDVKHLFGLCAEVEYLELFLVDPDYSIDQNGFFKMLDKQRIIETLSECFKDGAHVLPLLTVAKRHKLVPEMVKVIGKTKIYYALWNAEHSPPGACQICGCP